MSYIKTWDDGLLLTLKHVVASRLHAKPNDEVELREMRMIEEELERRKQEKLQKT